MTNQHHPLDNYQLAMAYHRRLPDRIRDYLHAKGLPDTMICRYRLGWNGERITIPITNRDRQVVFFKLARDPDDTTGAPEMTESIEGAPELYGWERIVFTRQRIVICEGEFDRLLLEAQGIAAISSTAG